jgi:hypothetical protein
MRLFPTISPLNLIPGVILYILWFLSDSMFTTISLFIVSLTNFLLYLIPSRPRQLFFSDRSLLVRTPHAHVRPANAASRTWRLKIGEWLRGTQPPPALDSTIIELSVWQRGQLCEGIVITFSPITAVLRFFPDQSPAFSIFVPAFISLFLLVLVNQFHLAINDEKILGQELFKTQRNAIQRNVDEAAIRTYTGQALQRRASYREKIPEYGPGADLARQFQYQHREETSESDAEERRPRPRRSRRSGLWFDLPEE